MKLNDILNTLKGVYASDWLRDNQYFTNTLSHVKNDGLWLEFGVATGRTITIISKFTDNKIYGFDTFTGLPEDWGEHQEKGAYDQGGILPDVPDNVELFAGLFQDTLEDFLKEHPEPAAYIHLDADLYSSTKYVLDQLESRIVPGTVISFDEVYNNDVYLEHEMKAWLEFVERTGIDYKWITRTIHEQASVIIL